MATRRIAYVLIALPGVGCLASFGGHPQADTRVAMFGAEKGLLVFAAKHGGLWPATLDEAAPYMTGGRVPTDAWGRPFRYERVASEAGYVLVSLGADGREGGEGIDADLRSDDPE